MNPNGLVPTLEEDDGFLLWESNSIVRYLAGKHDKNGVLEPTDPQAARARQPVDGLAVLGGRTCDHAGVLGPDPHAAGKTRRAAIKTSQEKTDAAMQMLDAQLGKTAYVAGPRSPTATFRSASWPTATASWCPTGPRRRISSAGLTPSPSARRSTITSAAFR